MVCLAVEQGEAASFVRRVLRHPRFNTQAKRLGRVVRISHWGFRVFKLGSHEENTSWDT